MKSCDGWAGGPGGWEGVGVGQLSLTKRLQNEKDKKKVTGWRRQLAFVDTPLTPPHRRLLPAFISRTLFGDTYAQHSLSSGS